MTDTISAIDHFHDHIDVCARCRTSPFNMCPVGRARLAGTALHFIDDDLCTRCIHDGKRKNPDCPECGGRGVVVRWPVAVT
jgi:DnaJ-class molecular chaperone